MLRAGRSRCRRATRRCRPSRPARRPCRHRAISRRTGTRSTRRRACRRSAGDRPCRPTRRRSSWRRSARRASRATRSAGHPRPRRAGPRARWRRARYRSRASRGLWRAAARAGAGLAAAHRVADVVLQVADGLHQHRAGERQRGTRARRRRTGRRRGRTPRSRGWPRSARCAGARRPPRSEGAGTDVGGSKRMHYMEKSKQAARPPCRRIDKDCRQSRADRNKSRSFPVKRAFSPWRLPGWQRRCKLSVSGRRTAIRREGRPVNAALTGSGSMGLIDFVATRGRSCSGAARRRRP